MNPAPTGHEEGPPEGLNRSDRLTWWVCWKLARAAEGSSQGIGAVAHEYFVEHPTKPCTDKSTTCIVCRGLGYVVLTRREIREEYRSIRQRVCEARVITAEVFDREATAIVHRRDLLKAGPGFWLEAAREIETKQLRDRAKRRQETRSRW